MIHYERIKNEFLRKLIQNSVSIQSLDDEKKEEFIERAALLPKEGEEAMIALLQEEAEKIATGKYMSAEEKQKRLEENLRKVTDLKNGVLKMGRVEHEKMENSKDSQVAEDLLKQL